MAAISVAFFNVLLPRQMIIELERSQSWLGNEDAKQQRAVMKGSVLADIGSTWKVREVIETRITEEMRGLLRHFHGGGLRHV